MSSQARPNFHVKASPYIPDLAVRDKEGKPYSLRYEQVNPMLLNEFLKAPRKIEEQGGNDCAAAEAN